VSQPLVAQAAPTTMAIDKNPFQRLLCCHDPKVKLRILTSLPS
jgi:hypothetical protein